MGSERLATVLQHRMAVVWLTNTNTHIVVIHISRRRRRREVLAVVGGVNSLRRKPKDFPTSIQPPWRHESVGAPRSGGAGPQFCILMDYPACIG